MAEDRVEVEVELEPDRASAERSADVLGDALTKAMEAAIKVFATQMRGAARDIAAEFRKVGVDRLATDMQGIVTDTKRAANATRDFTDDMKALELRARAVGEVISKTGNNPGLGASIETQLRRITTLQKEAEENAVELARNPQLVRAYEQRGDSIRTALSQDVRFINKLIEQQSALEIEEQRRRTAVAVSEARERTAAINAERSRNVVATQREAALELEATRGANKRRLQDDRDTARQRLAIFQATVQQIRVIERAIGAGVRGIGSLFGRTQAAVSSSTSAIHNIFRRSDSQLSAGLTPALERRTSIFRREMRETESVIQSSTIRQSRLLQQAEAQASRGVAGLASGRSQVGSLLGGGLAIGGGFALISKLREGFQESVNLNESLNKTQQIFGAATDSILEFADKSVDALFVTKSAALEAAANFGIFGKSAGLAGPELADFSKRLVLLATDLASFNNTNISDATTAIAAALRGESEPIRKYGVLLNEAVLQQRALSEGIVDTIRKLTPQERVLAANAEILAQTAVQQGDAARTADDFANSSRRAAAASTEFFASIAKFAVPLATTFTNGILPILRTLTDLVNNDVGPGLKVLRDGLIGAGTALAGLLAAKVAGEALQFLALGIKAVLTPMGLLVASVALIGAAVKILAERSPQLRRVFDDIREAIGDRLRQGVELVGRGLSFLGDVIVERVVPAAFRLATAVRDRLVEGFRATVSFVTGSVIPAFVRFGGFLRNDVLPFLIGIATAVRDRVAPAFRSIRAFVDPAVDAISQLGPAIRDAFSGNFATLSDLLQPVLDFVGPATEAFKELGSTVKDLFSGNFSDALARLQTFSGAAIAIAAGTAAGIALAFVNPFLGIGVAVAGILGVAFGPRLIDVIRPQVERFGRFLSDLFSPRNLQDVGVAFLKVVRRIGEIIGGIVTDRRFVLGLAAVVAAIAATAGAAILGFGEGVRDNLPELVDLLSDGLTLAFREAFKQALANPQIIVGVLAGAAMLSAIRRSMASAGAAGASGFTQSFVSGTRSFFQSNAFASGFFATGAGLQRAANDAAAKAARALVTARNNAARDLDLLGQPARVFAVSSAGTATATDDPVKRLQQVEQAFGKAQVAGALFRANTSRAFGSLQVAAGGLAQVIGGNVTEGLSQARTGLSGFTSSVRSLFSRLRTDLRAAGIGLGQALGGAIASGIGAVLSGQALGTSESGVQTGLGIAGIIASALFAGAAVGGGPQGVVVGGTVAAVGLVTAAFARSGKAAEEAEDRIKGYIQALRDVEDPAGAAAFATEAVNQGLLDLAPSAKQALFDAGFSVKDFAAQFADGTLDIDGFSKKLRGLPQDADDLGQLTDGLSEGTRDALGFIERLADELKIASEGANLDESLQFGSDQVIRDLGSVTSRVEHLGGAINEIARTGGTGAVLGSALFGPQGTPGVEHRLQQAADAVGDVNRVVGLLNQQRTDDLNEQISTVSDSLTDARDAADLALSAVTSFFTGRQGTTNQLLDQLVLSVGGVGSSLGEGIATGMDSALGGAQVRTALDGFGEQIAGVIQQAVTDNPNITTADLSSLLQPLRDSIQQSADIDPDDMFTQASADALVGNINGFLSDGNFDAAVDFANQAQASADALQEEWNRLNVALATDVVFSKDQIQRALVDALELTPTEASRILSLANVSNVFTSGFDEMGVALGTSTVDGYVRGIEGGTERVDSAVRNMASAAELALADQLDAHSPSRVFEALGTTIPAGLAEGILAGSPAAAVALRELSSTLFQRLQFLPGTLAENFRSVLEESFVEIPDVVEPATASIRDFVGEVFTAVSALEGLAGVDLSKLEVGISSAANQASNAGRTSNQFANDLRFLFNSTQQHPPGWIQTEDGTWVPPEFFAPPPSVVAPRAPSLDMREGDVVSPNMGNTGVGQFIEAVNIYETSNARATARETIMALKTAPFTTAPVSGATRIPADVVG